VLLGSLTVKQICLRCERTSADGNLWCQEPDCPAEDKPTIFDYGQFFGDAKITRLLYVSRTSAYYDAERGKTRILLKVAHPHCENQLKREAELLQQEQAERRRPAHPLLPTLLPAYQYSTLEEHPHGKAIVGGEERFYEVLHPIDGDFLRNWLVKNPQPWYEHAVWQTISLAELLAYLHLKMKRLHLALNPDAIIVRADLQGIPRPVLVDLGVMISETRPEHLEWLHYHALPAYTAPELTYTTPESIAQCLPATPASDVYELGLLLYEMLAGFPAHEDKRKNPDLIRDAVRSHRPASLSRSDLPEAAEKIVDQAISRSPTERYPDLSTFARDLRSMFGKVPREKKPRTSNQRLVIVGAVAGALFSVLILLAALSG